MPCVARPFYAYLSKRRTHPAKFRANWRKASSGDRGNVWNSSNHQAFAWCFARNVVVVVVRSFALKKNTDTTAIRGHAKLMFLVTRRNGVDKPMLPWEAAGDDEEQKPLFVENTEDQDSQLYER